MRFFSAIAALAAVSAVSAAVVEPRNNDKHVEYKTVTEQCVPLASARYRT